MTNISHITDPSLLSGPKSSAVNKFEGRKLYQEHILNVGSFDLWGKHRYYGLIDREGNAIFPSEQNLKQVKSDETIFALNFVVDAFNDFIKYIDEHLAARRILNEGVLSNINAQKGWISATNLHHNYMSDIYDATVNIAFADAKTNSKIISYDAFLKFMLRFIEEHGHRTPLSRGGFIKSSGCPHNISGLIIELSDDNYDDDMLKYFKWIKDVNFEFYKNAALKFGFKIDKNAPWRLISDVSSKITQKYMSSYDISFIKSDPDDLFNSYYYRTYEHDIEITRTYLKQMYASYLTAYPFMVSGTKVKKRGTIKPKSVNFWVEFIVRVKLAEAYKNKDPQFVKNAVFKAQKIAQHLDLLKSMRYIEDVAW